jgi:hypothetical protein
MKQTICVGTTVNESYSFFLELLATLSVQRLHSTDGRINEVEMIWKEMA